MSDSVSATTSRIKPLFIVKPKTMTRRDIRRAEKEAGICIVECEDPQGVRFLDPPIGADMDAQTRAALSLFRYIKDNTTSPTTTFYGMSLVKWFVDALMQQHQPERVEQVTKVKSR